VSTLIVIAGPSGTGKGTIVRRLLERVPMLRVSVSATTRAPRPGEEDGRDYWFISPRQFQQRYDDGDFLEAFEVYGARYGTPRAAVEAQLAEGNDVVAEVDVQGALAIRDAFPEALLVFVQPPSREVQRRRLHDRDPDADPDALEARLAQAEAEEALSDRFDAVVVNDDLDRAVDEILQMLEARRGEAI
jgi:guanylate kinase